MKSREPPKLATWLLRRLSNGRHAESLIGDLHERFAGGQTAAWYWGQVFAAAASSAARAFAMHGGRLALAVAVAWGVMLGWFFLNMALTRGDMVQQLWFAWSRHHHYLHFLGHHHMELSQRTQHEFFFVFFWAGTLLRFACFTLSGWALGRLFPAHRYFGVLILILTAMLWRFVPWRIAPVYELSTHSLIHDVTAIAGLLIGAIVLARSGGQKETPCTERARRSESAGDALAGRVESDQFSLI